MMLKVSDYPQLKTILWDYHSETISSKYAFAMYETRWAFVDELSIGKKEVALINMLIKHYGKGFFLPDTTNKTIKNGRI